ncbi:ABC transporter substrate-binding protein [Nocardiopsis sp. RSe5-2]|uniref:ABC transporter substrate-binding protein n=1 Tax=Nocardiopsis endophytica TaxID=3018445 RepID=A0ABT4UDJ2_9ACTN|nr:ABC transporter substrate-binding protein [Nocardiopsis endophytica]MDA2815049.1 ABC transporter substrate-binding protein [Nocardiopsis endophytica]
MEGRAATAHPLSPARRLATGAAAAVLALAPAACGSGTDAADGPDTATRAFESDHTGGEVDIPESPERVVAIGWAVPVLISVDEADLVGVSRGTQDTSLTPDELERVESLPSVGTDLEIDVEKVAELEPDLIVSGLASAMDFDYAELEQVAPVAVAAMDAPVQWKETSGRIADAAGVADAHAELIDEYDARAEELSQTYADELDGTTFASVAAWGDGGWVLEHREAHGPNVLADAGLEFTEEAGDGAFSENLSPEELDRLNDYDAVIVRAEENGDPEAEVQKIMDQGPWDETTPAKEDRVYPVPFVGAMSYTTGLLVFDELEERVLKQL